MPLVKQQSASKASHHKFVPNNKMLKGVKAKDGIKNQSIALTINPTLAGKHIIQENNVPKCAEILELAERILSKILNGPLPKTIMLERPYTAMQYKNKIKTLLMLQT
jgi:hypothetical protein